MTTTTPSNGQRLLAFIRRLGAQAVLSASVMAGLHMASVNGLDLRDLLPSPAAGPEHAAPALPPPLRLSGVPARYDLPVQAGGLLESLIPRSPVETAGREMAGPLRPPAGDATAARRAAEASRPILRPDRAPAAPKIAETRRVVVPTPRPIETASRSLASPTLGVSEATAREFSGVLPFDMSKRSGGPSPIGHPTGDRDVTDVAELVRPDAIPMPVLSEEAFGVGGIVPSGAALLHRTAEMTGTAAQAVTGTALRLIDLVR